MCERFRCQLQDVMHEDKKVKLVSEFKQHVELAQQERNYYITSAKKAESQLNNGCHLIECELASDAAFCCCSQNKR